MTETQIIYGKQFNITTYPRKVNSKETHCVDVEFIQDGLWVPTHNVTKADAIAISLYYNHIAEVL